MTTGQMAKVKGQRANLGKNGRFLPFAIRHLPFAMLFAMSGCHTSHNDGPTGTFGVAPGFVVFKDELQSGGGAILFPGGENQTLSFNDTSNPISRRSIRYSWTGDPVSNPGCTPNPTHNFAGFDLIHTTQQSAYTGTPGRNLQSAGYTKVTFEARGSLSSRTIIKVEVSGAGNASACGHVFSPCISLYSPSTPSELRDDQVHPCGNVAPLTSDWSSYSINVRPEDQASIKDFFKASFIFSDPIPGSLAPGQGGTAYFDEIQYVQK